MTDLTARILAVVTASPGTLTSVLCRDLGVRKSVVLAELRALQREQLIRSEPGVRGAKCWFVVDAELGCSHGSREAHPPEAVS